MGRHSSESRWPYLRSVLGYAVPWLVIAVIVGIAVWIAVGAVGGDPISVGDTSSRTSPAPSASPSPTPGPTESPTAAPTGDGEGRDREPPVTTSKERLITKGVTVQVLNGTGGVEGAAEDMANRLAELGYEIYAISTGLTADHTTVYWSNEGGRDAAIALAAHFGWDVGPAPPSLSGEVDIAVVVGPDEI